MNFVKKFKEIEIPYTTWLQPRPAACWVKAQLQLMTVKRRLMFNNQSSFSTPYFLTDVPNAFNIRFSF